uniref:Polyketide synthase n=1 Tax=Peronospora matthiolae TaxID=2874970 RepID=A0AAV1TNZ0_9STRA
MRKGYNLLVSTGEMMGGKSNAISGLISKYLSNVLAALTVVTCDPQATSMELCNQAMKNLTIKSALPSQTKPLVGNLFFHGISMHAPPKDKENDMIRLDTAVLVEATSPLGLHSSLTITDVRMNVNLTGVDEAPRKLSAVSLQPDRLAAVEAN